MDRVAHDARRSDDALRRKAVATDERTPRVNPFEAWQSLVEDGQWSLGDVFESADRRLMVARQNQPGTHTPLLTHRERSVFGLRLRGHGGKCIAYELGLSQATVSRTLASGMGKLGLSSAIDLARFVRLASANDTVVTPRAVSVLAPPTGLRASCFVLDDHAFVVLTYPVDDAPSLPRTLTRAESAVAKALLRGLPLRAIARARETSPRTIANQARAIYCKLGVNSRFELGTLLHRHRV